MARGRRRRHVRLGALSLTLGGAAFALIQILQATIGAFNPRPLVTVMIAACVALVGSTLGRLRQRLVDARRFEELLRVWPLRRIRASDGLTLGVFPARQLCDSGELPSYVPRDIDARLGDALAGGGFVLIVGPARSGKSRTAFESASRVLGDRAVVIPADGPALSALAQDARSGFGADAVWWLDDLERFVDHMSGTELSILLDQGLTVVATLRQERWQAMLQAGGDEGERGRRLRGAAALFALSANLSEAEVARAAQQFADIDFSHGIGSAFAAADEAAVSRRVVDVTAPRGRPDPVLVLAAVSSLLVGAALAGVISSGGFARATPPPLGQQLDAIRQRAAAANQAIVFVRPEQLHGFDQTSYVFVLRPTSSGSDELRIYDVVDGWLRLRLDFRPRTHGPQFASAARPFADTKYVGGVSVGGADFTAAALNKGADDFRLEAVRFPDLLNNDERELVADYTYTASGGFPGPQLPIIASWNDLGRRYELQPLLASGQPFPPGRRWTSFWPGPYVLRNIATNSKLRGYPVDGYLLLPGTGRYPPTLIIGKSVSSGGQSGLAVSQYSVRWANGHITFLDSFKECDTIVIVKPDASPPLDHILRAAVGLAPQRVAISRFPSCSQFLSVP